MKNNTPLVVIGLLVNALVTLFMFYSERYEGLAMFSLVALIISVFGLILMLANKIKIGGILFIIGSVFFVPIGLVGIAGARKIMNEEKEQKFKEQIYGTN